MEIQNREIRKKKIARKTPLVWIMIDEAHEFLPFKGQTAATNALITILREGRQPGVSLILASQQPGKIHTDVMTQADTVLAHRLTAKIDVDALGKLMQSYMRHGLDDELNKLPRVKGAAIVFDDLNEKLYPIQMRPRFTWHGGAAPTAADLGRRDSDSVRPGPDPFRLERRSPAAPGGHRHRYSRAERHSNDGGGPAGRH